MRPSRNFKTNQCCHLISCIANRAFFLNDEAKTRFVERLWCVAAFSCVEVLAYRFMSNRFHILVYVPDLRAMSDDELLARIRALYSERLWPRFGQAVQTPVEVMILIEKQCVLRTDCKIGLR